MAVDFLQLLFMYLGIMYLYELKLLLATVVQEAQVLKYP